MSELRQYDPLQVVGSFTSLAGSVDILDGSIDGGDFAALATDAVTWTRENDRGGNATRVKSNNRGGSISISLSASSPTNAALSTLAQADYVSENVVGVLVLRDLNGTTVITCNGAFIEDIPDFAFGSTRGQRTWVFQCAEIVVFAGGHTIA